MLRGVLIVLVLLAVGAVGALYLLGSGWLGNHWGGGQIEGDRIPLALISERYRVQQQAAAGTGAPTDKQIVFGDLHVHTTYSFDAFVMSMPLNQGEGAHPPADACDFARYCSALDFWSINDHAIVLTPENWSETVDSMRQCAEIAGDPENPDVVPFLGWEWTQIGTTPDNHYGHKNVIFRDLDDASIPTRPIAAGVGNTNVQNAAPSALALGMIPLVTRDPAYLDLVKYLRERAAVPRCPDGPVRDLPVDCRETAVTPGELFAKLDDWGLTSMVIPHGTTWGYYTPLGSSWDKQLTRAQHDPERQRLIEVFSGHGNSEQFRTWREIAYESNGDAVCPPPSPKYLPSCWRAGEIIRARCLEAGEPEEECETRALEARANYLLADVSGFLTVPGSTTPDWLDAGQCSDCFQPSFRYRPRNSVQYIMALTNGIEAEGSDPLRFRFGFIAASDNHTGRPGTGYKEYGRWYNTESGFETLATSIVGGDPRGGQAEPLPRSVLPEPNPQQFFGMRETERGSSFFLTGGLVAAHSAGRSRGAIWDALEKKEVYGTSGPRILLWFDLLDDDGSRIPMGGAAERAEAPLFEVRAVGSLEQQPGCPEYATSGLPPERLERLCRGECYNPSDRRRVITRIEVVKISPQRTPAESVDRLIQDPYRIIPCPLDPAGCTVQFQDPDFDRDSLYYVRAIEAPSAAVNAGNLRCERDQAGACVKTNACQGVPHDDDCLTLTEERAWSSPIFVDKSPTAVAALD